MYSHALNIATIWVQANANSTRSPKEFGAAVMEVARAVELVLIEENSLDPQSGLGESSATPLPPSQQCACCLKNPAQTELAGS